MPKYGQPVISRETRLLLITIVVSVCTLWLLARLRFQDRPVAATVAPVLAQLRPRVQLRRSGTFAVEPSAGCGRDHRRLRRRQAGAPNRRCGGNRPRRIRFRANAPSRSRRAGGDGLDAAHLRLSALSRRGQSRGRDALARPVFVGCARTGGEPCLARLDLAPPARPRPRARHVCVHDRRIARGSCGAACGRACARARTSRARSREPPGTGEPARPGTTWKSRCSRRRSDSLLPGSIRPDLRPTISTAADVIETFNGQRVASADDWHARVRNVARGDEVKLRVRSEGAAREVSIVAAAVVESPEDPSLGLRMRPAAREGVEVLGVDLRSRADRAGLQAGDLITVFGPQKAPTPAHVTRTFDTLPFGGKVLVAVTRGDGHHIAVVEKNIR